MDTMILKDGTNINLNTGASLVNLTVACADANTLGTLFSKLTKDNLSSVQIKNEAGFSNGVYSNTVLMPGNYEIIDGGFLVTIRLREMTDIEKKLAELEASQSVQDQTIAGLVNEVV